MSKELPIRIDNRLFYLVFLLFVFVLLWNNHRIGLWDEDEAAYAGFALQMLESSDWLTIQFDEAEIHRKTPLLFWMIASLYFVFGVSEFVLRLPAFFALIGCFILIWQKSKHWLSVDGAKLAAIVFAGTISPLVLSKIALTDSILLFWGTLAFFSFLELMHRPNWLARLSLWFALAMGVLTKGPVLLIVVAGVFLVSLIDPVFRKSVWREQPWFGGILALLPFAIWAYMSYAHDYQSYLDAQVNEDFSTWWQQTSRGHKLFLLPFLWDWYILRRIGGSVLGQTGFPAYHLVSLTVAFLCWIGALYPMLLIACKRLKEDTLIRSILGWLLFSWIFWEFMSSKLPSYSLLAIPAFCVLLVKELSDHPHSLMIYHRIRRMNVFLFISIAVALVMVPRFISFDSSIQSNMFSIALPLTIAGVAISIFVASARWGNWVWPSIFSLSFFLIITSFFNPLSKGLAIQSTRLVADQVYSLYKENPSAEVALYQLDLKQQKMSLYFYLKNRVGVYSKLNQQQVISRLKKKEELIIITSEEGMNTLHQYNLNKKKILYRSTDDQLKEHSFYLLY